MPNKSASLAARSRTTFADTLAYDYIGAPPWTSLHRQLQRAADRLDRRISYRAFVADIGAAVRMLAAGFGVCILPREVAMLQPASRWVTCIPLKEGWALQQLIFCHRK